MTQKNEDSPQLPVLRKPKAVPDWIPQTSGSLSVDDVIREIAVIGFDRNEMPAETRLKALDKLLKHKGGYIERTESKFIDATQVAVATEMFKQMTLEERQEWLSHHTDKIESTLPPRSTAPASLHPDSPPDPPSPPASQASTTLEDLHGK